MLRAREVSVRPFRSSDDAFLLELSKAAFGEFSRDGGRSTLGMAEHWTCLVAEMTEASPLDAGAPASELRPQRTRAVGFAILKTERGEIAELLAIAVLEGERGRGLGRALLEATERRARATGASGMLLHTADANVAAFELFVKSGFRVKRRLPRFYVNVYDACEMQKDW